MTPDIPPIVLLVDPHRESLECYARHFENAGLWVAGTTAYDELLSSVEELHPDIIIADTDTDTGDRRHATLGAMKRHPELGGVPLIVLVPPRLDDAPEADVTLRKPVSPEFLLRRTLEVLARSRELRGQSNAVLRKSHSLKDRSSRLIEKVAAISGEMDESRRVCPGCATRLDWVERDTIGGVTYDYFRWCPKGCGLFCFNRDAEHWVKLA